MLQVGVVADDSQEFHLMFEILTCQLSRHYCMIEIEKHTHTLRAESPSYYHEQPVDTAQVEKCVYVCASLLCAHVVGVCVCLIVYLWAAHVKACILNAK